MSDLYTIYKDKLGSNVVYLKPLKFLSAETIGILTSVNDINENQSEPWCHIVYPQNSGFEDDGKGGYKPRKNAPNQIYAHSANLNDIKLADE